MASFAKNIPVHGHLIVFTFYKMQALGGVKYHISAIDESGQPLHFDMKVSAGEWKIVNAPAVPEWIQALESRLEQVIFENDEP